MSSHSNDSQDMPRRIAEVLSGASRVLLCGHVRADGDCVGSMAAVYHVLRYAGKTVRMFFRGPVLESFLDFAPDGESPDGGYPRDFGADVTLCLDAADPERIVEGFLDLAEGSVVNVDHHGTNPGYGDINWVEPDSSSVGELAYELVRALGGDEAMTPEVASALYLAVATDTGGFRFGNTTARSLRIASELVEAGADPHEVAVKVWESRKLETVRIESAVMGAMRFECDGKLAWSPLRQETLRANGGEENEPDNLPNGIRAIRGVEVAALVRETPAGQARVSLRSRGTVDVSAIAARFGGGGHAAAAGADLRYPFDEACERLVAAAREAMGECE